MKTETWQQFTNGFINYKNEIINNLNTSTIEKIEDNFEEVKKMAPVDTGNHKSKITLELKNNQTKIEGKISSGEDVEYAEYLEFGTIRQRAQPHFAPAIFETNIELDKDYDKIFRNAEGGI